MVLVKGARRFGPCGLRSVQPSPRPSLIKRPRMGFCTGRRDLLSRRTGSFFTFGSGSEVASAAVSARNRREVSQERVQNNPVRLLSAAATAAGARPAIVERMTTITPRC